MAQNGLDPRDHQILVELQKNGRISNVELATKVGLSPSACLRRVQALESRGFIAGYAARLDPKRLGLSVTAFVSVQIAQDQEEATESFRAAVRDMPHVVVKDMAAYDHFLTGDLLHQDYVASASSSIVLREIKYTTALPIASAF
jgi:Lrp/AsnC family leucine-responsive transcriptional regulator